MKLPVIYKSKILNRLKFRAPAPKNTFLSRARCRGLGELGSEKGAREGRGKGGFQASGAYQAMNSKSDGFQFDPASRTWRFVLFASARCRGEIHGE